MTRGALMVAVLLVLALLASVSNPGWAQKEVSLRQLQEAVRNKPNDPSLHYLLGVKYQNEGQDSKALAAYQKAVSLNPRYAEALLGLGSVKAAQGDLDGAVKALKKAVQFDPKNKEARTWLSVVYGKQGLALLDQGKAAEAAKVLQQAAANNPKDTAALNNLGVALAALGDLDLAAQAFQKAIKANPANDGAHYNLGCTHLQSGDKTQALNQYAALTTLGSGYGGELFALMSYPKGYPVDTPYSPPQWGQSTPYKPLPATALPNSPEIADALRQTPDLQIPAYGSSLTGGELPGSQLK
jgi:Flp pilus assembly protein TadD